MSGAMNRHCIPGLTMSIALTGNLQECPGIIKTMHTGFVTRIVHYANAPVLTRKKRTLHLRKICSVLMLSVNSNELSKV